MPDSNISGKDTSSQIQSDRVKLQLIFLNANTGVIVCRFRIAYGFSVAKAAWQQANEIMVFTDVVVTDEHFDLLGYV